MRLAFMGTPDFAVPALRALVAAGHEVACVYCQPPRPAGRGHKERPSAIQAAAEELDLPVRTPKTLRDDAEQDAFAALGLDVAVVAAYGLILPTPILEAPTHGCLNIHASLLPRWRGAAPIQRAILSGDSETGITIMQMDEGLDTGAMLLQESVPINGTTTAQSLHDALAACGGRLIVDALARLAAGSLEPQVQPEDGVTYAKKISPADARISWKDDADAVDRTVRAFAPRPGAWFEADGKRIKLLEAEAVDASGDPGVVLDDRLTIACGSGAIRATRLQREGKRALAVEDFQRGSPIAAGTRLP
ncbi:MAG: methionyl-tRNA formyltransferase [Pseudomonadota bacterium]